MRGKRINWTEDKINFIIEQYSTKQMNTIQLAEYFNCSNDTISRRLKENGIVPHKFYEDLTGEKIGLLTVLKKSDKSGRKLYWDCQCECGNFVTIVGDSLRQRRNLSCGCINSKTEKFISTLLKVNEILFVQQYTFDDLVSENNKKLRFDFGIIKNNKLSYLIEYDGEQHFEKNIQNTGWNTKENFKKIQKRDLLKNQYCLNHNIPLIRIPYTHKENIVIEDLLLETSKFIIGGENNEAMTL